MFGFTQKFPFYQQRDQRDCGPTCLKMIAAYHGKDIPISYLREQAYISRTGVSLKGIAEAANKIGLRAMAVKVPFQVESGQDALGLIDAPLPCVAHWGQDHFVVVVQITKRHVLIADPKDGMIRLSHKEFQRHWLSDEQEGILMLLEVTSTFGEASEDWEETQPTGRWRYLLGYMRPFRKLGIQVLIGILAGSALQLIFPFLSQSVVDIGINNRDSQFLILILAAQLATFAGINFVNAIQSWILLHVSSRINVAMIEDFLAKMLDLPIRFFDTKVVGDLMQRIDDHHRIQALLTSSTLTILLSITNLVLFSIVLGFYHPMIFGIFWIGAVFYFTWIALFLKRRKAIDYKRFRDQSANQSTIIEMIQGMQEIKLQNSEVRRNWQWKGIQARLFRSSLEAMRLSQYQDMGAKAINQVKDILIIFVAAQSVIEGEMTLGMLLAVQFIVGQMNGPLEQMVMVIRQLQDAAISIDRALEVQGWASEKSTDLVTVQDVTQAADISLQGVFFRYNELDPYVLKDIHLTIPRGKVTAIVGASGSGKTTLVKLLLGIYPVEKGTLHVDGTPLTQINPVAWRGACGAVLQDGFIFSDTINNNITESTGFIDPAQLKMALEASNLNAFVDGLPLKGNTMIGPRGKGISQGQRQRLLIARAIYKLPHFLFFDEATNALDAENERLIVHNLDQFYHGKTVVVVAHRLSTVKNADQIIVLDGGEIVERGNHAELIQAKGRYFHLIRNQLELGT
jgi:ATP-binding cassette, subfamily B, bacterial